jgi:hypothetical protein
MNEVTIEIDKQTGQVVMINQNNMGISVNFITDSVSDNKITLKVVATRNPSIGPGPI